jgi:penicillin-binding protein 2
VPVNNSKKINVHVDKSIFDVVKEGMFLVVNGSGTATRSRIQDIKMAGKTGTAQNPHGKDHALFIGFAPFENPKIAFAVVIENVGFGATWAAPVAKKLVEAYLKRDEYKNELAPENKVVVNEPERQEDGGAN